MLFGGALRQPFNAGTSNWRGHTPGRGLSVTEIMSQRENKAGAYQNGQPVAPGTKLFSSGWNTSGVGPGTRGYMGSWRPGGYNFGMGTGRPSAKTADEFYAQRDEISGNPLDNLELGNSTLMKSFLQNAMAEARGGTGTAGGAAADPWAGRTTFGTEGSMPAAGGAQPTVGAQEPNAMEIQQMIADARRQETMDMLAARGNQDPSASFFGGEGTTQGATIDGIPSDLYFQFKANESGDTNRFASPFASPDDDKGNPQAWQFSHRLAPFLKRLGVGQPFAPRRPL